MHLFYWKTSIWAASFHFQTRKYFVPFWTFQIYASFNYLYQDTKYLEQSRKSRLKIIYWRLFIDSFFWYIGSCFSELLFESRKFNKDNKFLFHSIWHISVSNSKFFGLGSLELRSLGLTLVSHYTTTPVSSNLIKSFVIVGLDSFRYLLQRVFVFRLDHSERKGCCGFLVNKLAKSITWNYPRDDYTMNNEDEIKNTGYSRVC